MSINLMLGFSEIYNIRPRRNCFNSPIKISKTHRVKNNTEECCPICHECMFCKDLIQCKQCNNLFDVKCIEKWVNIKNSCPLCRIKWFEEINSKIRKLEN